MAANPFECKACTGPLEICGDQGRCTYCGEVQPIPKANEGLFNRANRLRCENKDFDAAMRVYEQIVLEWPDEAEAYWGLVLCRYGIEYVADGGGQVPTCHRTILASILQDTDYRAAVDHAEGETRAYYEKQGRLIDAYQKKINQIAAQERPYDVFISFKSNDEDGGTTDDSFLAQQLFNCLTQKLGLRVFFSKYTLRDKAGSEFEPIIFAALSSARVMVLIGTRPKYLQASWVKNEWSRFLGMMNEPSAGKKWLIPALKGMKPNELPTELNRFQAVDLGGFDAINELSSNIDLRIGDERIRSESLGTAAVEATARAVQALEVSKQIEAGNSYLAVGNFPKAVAYYAKVIETDPTLSSAYWGRFLASREVRNVAALSRLEISFSEETDFQAALQFASTPAERGRCEQAQVICGQFRMYERDHAALVARVMAVVRDSDGKPSGIEVLETHRRLLRSYLEKQAMGVAMAEKLTWPRNVLVASIVLTVLLVLIIGVGSGTVDSADYVPVFVLGGTFIAGVAWVVGAVCFAGADVDSKEAVEVRPAPPSAVEDRAALKANFEKVKAYVHSEVDRNNRELVNSIPHGFLEDFIHPTDVLDQELDAAFAQSLGQEAGK